MTDSVNFGGFHVTAADVRTHADAIAPVADTVRTAAQTAAPGVANTAFGPIGAFFTVVLGEVANTVLGGMGNAASSVDDMRAGLSATATGYEQIDEEHARVFGTPSKGDQL